MSEDFLRGELHQALAGRTPDRTAMLNRIAANRAAGSRPPRRALRLAGSALAVTTVLGIGGVAKWAMADDHGPAPVPAAPVAASAGPTPSPAPSPSSGPAKAPVTSRPTTPPTSRPATSAAATEVRGHPGDTQVEKGSLWSDGSIAGAGASTVTLRAKADLTELDLTVRVARTAGLAGPEATHDAPAADITTSVERRADAVLYHFTLRKGATLPAGTYVFTARYTHSGDSRNAGDDTYEAFAFSVDRKRLHVYGNFFPAD